MVNSSEASRISPISCLEEKKGRSAILAWYYTPAHNFFPNSSIYEREANGGITFLFVIPLIAALVQWVLYRGGRSRCMAEHLSLLVRVLCWGSPCWALSTSTELWTQVVLGNRN